jgi:ABC-type nickel/cobalt efflux system permease component RcnA
MVLAMAMCLAPPLSFAHPMGNFSVNHYAQISIRQGEIEVLYMIDMAEIPTYQEIQQSGIVAREGDASLSAYLPATGAALRDGLTLEVDGQRLSLELVSQEIIFPPGAGGLPTMKMGFVYRAQLPLKDEANVHLRYTDLNFQGHAGWKEIIVAAPDNVLVSSSVPKTDRSNRLSNYPTDLLNSPPQDLEAQFVFSLPALAAANPQGTARKAAGRNEMAAPAFHAGVSRRKAVVPEPKQPAAASQDAAPATSSTSFSLPLHLEANQQATPRSSFTELIATRKLSFWFLLLAAAIAAGLGSLHALEPGHGKTIVAAYLVGSRGTARHALLLGLIVTAAHTAGVYLLGGITLYAERYILPERIYPFLGVLSGILIAGMGCYLLLQRYLGAEFAHKHNYEVPSASEAAERKARTGPGELLLLGITGGMVPCPGALVVLLSAVALHRTVLGLFLIVAFSIGLAAVLIAMGLAAVYAGRLLSRMRLDSPLVQRWLPMMSATAITILGFGITLRSLMAAGIVHFRM